MPDVGRKTVPDKGRLNKERPVTKAPSVSILHRKEFFLFFSSEVEQRVRDGVYRERLDDRYGGMVTIKETENESGYLETKCSM